MRNSEPVNYVVVMPDGTEVFIEDRHNRTADGIAEQAVCDSGLKTNRYAPETVEVVVSRLEIKNGKLSRRQGYRCQITPPLRDRTEAEFNADMDELLGGLPEPFRRFVANYAWDQGHANGYGEVISCAEDLVEGLAPAIEQYANSLKGK